MNTLENAKERGVMPHANDDTPRQSDMRATEPSIVHRCSRKLSWTGGETLYEDTFNAVCHGDRQFGTTAALVIYGHYHM